MGKDRILFDPVYFGKYICGHLLYGFGRIDRQTQKQLMSDFKPIKILDRDQNGGLAYTPFTANGIKYKFIKPGDPIGIKKWTMYEQMKVVVGSGKTFSELATYFKDLKALLGADKPFADIRVEAILATDSMQKAIVEMSKERYNQAFYLCSIFIYKDGSDPYEWDFETATEAITNWQEERISEIDLFFFAVLLIPGFKAMFDELQEAANRMTEKLLGAST